MGNKMSHNVETFIRKENTHLQYTPPIIHRTDPAEQEIFTWKNRFLSGITGIPKTFPISPTKQTSPSTCFGHAAKILLYCV
jgi:hypothetical protein